MLYFAKNQHQAAEVVNSKPELLACAAHWNPFRSQTFAWVDAGVARSGNRLDKETYDFDIGKFKMDVRLHQKSYHTKFFNGFKLVCQGRQDRQRLSRCNVRFDGLPVPEHVGPWNGSFFIFLKSAKCDKLKGMQCLLGFFFKCSLWFGCCMFRFKFCMDILSRCIYIQINFSINMICTCIYVRKTYFDPQWRKCFEGIKFNIKISPPCDLDRCQSRWRSNLWAWLTLSITQPDQCQSMFFVSEEFMQRSVEIIRWLCN